MFEMLNGQYGVFGWLLSFYSGVLLDTAISAAVSDNETAIPGKMEGNSNEKGSNPCIRVYSPFCNQADEWNNQLLNAA